MARRRRGDCLRRGGPANVRGHRRQRLRGWPAAVSSPAKLLSEPMLRKFRENSEEGYDDDRTGNSAGDRTHPGSSRRDRGRTRLPGRREGEGPGQGRRDEGQGGPDEGPGAGQGHRDVRATTPEPASTESAGPESAGSG